MTRPWLDALLVLRDGEVVWERYHNGYDADTPHQLKSMTKSVLSTLVGIALDRGVLRGLDDPIGAYLAADAPPDARPATLEITIGDCLLMRSGLEWDEHDGPMMEWVTGDDPLHYALVVADAAAEPGSRWRYSTLDSQLVGACLSRAAGRSLLDFADEHLFTPLGVGDRRWGTSVLPGRWTTGEEVGGSELHLRMRDVARFGELIRQGGALGGRRLVPEHWVTTSTARQPGVDAGVIAADSEAFAAASRWLDGYGHHWWRAHLGGHDAVVAAGQGGQYCAIVPDLELVVAQAASPVVPPELRPIVDEAIAQGLVDGALQPTPEADPAALLVLRDRCERAAPGWNAHDDQTAGLALLDEIAGRVAE